MTQEFVTLPREVVEQAIDALFCTDSQEGSPAYNFELKAVKELRAALEQPQNHVPDAGNMVPTGWKLVPVEPTEKMIDFGRSLSSFPDGVYRDMLAAAPQPPTTEQSSAVQQLQGEQKPVAIPDECPRIIWFDDSDMRPMMFAGRGARDAALKAFERVSVQWNAHLFVRIQKNSRDDQYPCAPLYTNPQPKRETLTDEQSRRIYNEATYHASIAVFMTRIDAEHPDADDKGVSGWLQEAEDRVKHRITEAAHNIK